MATSRGNTLRFTTLFRDIERYCINDPEFLIFSLLLKRRGKKHTKDELTLTIGSERAAVACAVIH